MQNVKGGSDQAFLYHDLNKLKELKREDQRNTDENMKKVAKQFEGIYLNMMLASMRKAQDVLADENNPLNSPQVKFYRQMHDEQLTLTLSEQGGVGIADMMYKHLKESMDKRTRVPQPDTSLASVRRLYSQPVSANGQMVKDKAYIDLYSETDKAKKADKIVGADLTADAKAPVNEVVSALDKQKAFENPQAFVEKLLPIAKQVGRKYRLDPYVMVAQSALETGWGQHMIPTAKGENSHNLFGVKADVRWPGQKVAVQTTEFRGGEAKTEVANFRVYRDFGHSMEDYANFILSNPRYATAVQHANDRVRYTENLQKAGYATDPQYAQKIQRILNSDLMKTALRQY